MTGDGRTPADRGAAVERDAAAIRVVGGAPTDEETAAVAAVFTQLALERAASVLPLPDAAGRAGWPDRTSALRGPLRRGAGPQHR